MTLPPTHTPPPPSSPRGRGRPPRQRRGRGHGGPPPPAAMAMGMEACLAAAVVVEGEMDAMDVGATRSLNAPSTSMHESRQIAPSGGSVGRRCLSMLSGAPHCRHHAHQYHHHGLQGRRRTRSLSHVFAFVHAQQRLIKERRRPGTVRVKMPRRRRRTRRRRRS